ncbi:hypothetical protein FSB78_01545 [Sphingomonas ginsenosidivorax]|uniref:S8 family serine peptidase n=1 Tax=Sphingomonas ginsenosidivorax TaxID=862135 RepID=A0A5C6UCM7_9SPHN|nr:hypothetical protein [Sphingomonas ginsenosidivorax]TXC69785.1 hypothetical protein FSB78_01545 [Sphingomonas ginsenosidivorax]
MRIASQLITIAAICDLAPAGRAPAADHLVIARAIGTTPKQPVVEFVARHARPIPVTEAERPTLKDKSVRETVEELCGALSEGYLDVLNVTNPGLNAAAETKLGAAAYGAVWPACLAIHTDVTVTVRKGDTLSGIRLQATGKLAVDALFDHYFASSGLTKTSTLTVGRVLHLPFETLPTRLSVSDAELPKFAIDLRSAGGHGVDVDDRPVAKGAIIGAYQPPAGTTSGTADDCDGDEDVPWPFNATEVAEAYARNRRAPQSVVVVIVDNGFFGVPCSEAGCPPSGPGEEGFSTRFPRGFFAEADDYLSHATPYGPKTPLTPLNYGADDSLQINPVSGHGTHVAGLALGGPAFEAFRSGITDAPSG